MEKTAFNHKLPVDLKSRYRSICRKTGLTMTSQLIVIINDFCAKKERENQRVKNG